VKKYHTPTSIIPKNGYSRGEPIHFGGKQLPTFRQGANCVKAVQSMGVERISGKNQTEEIRPHQKKDGKPGDEVSMVI